VDILESGLGGILPKPVYETALVKLLAGACYAFWSKWPQRSEPGEIANWPAELGKPALPWCAPW